MSEEKVNIPDPENKLICYGQSISMMSKKPDLIRESVLYAILNNQPIPEVLQANYITNIYGALHSLYNFAKQKNFVPTEMVLLQGFSDDKIIDVIAKHYPPANGRKIYIQSYGIVHPPTDTWKQLALDKAYKKSGRPLGYWVLGRHQYTAPNQIHFELEHYKEDEVTDTIQVTIDLPYPVGPYHYYHNVEWFEQDIDTGHIHLDTFKTLFVSNNDPANPDFIFPVNYKDSHGYFPFILLGKYIGDDRKGTAEYEETRVALDKLHLRIKDLHKAINEDKQFDKFQHCTLSLHIDLIYDNTQGSLAYLHRFFKKYIHMQWYRTHVFDTFYVANKFPYFDEGDDCDGMDWEIPYKRNSDCDMSFRFPGSSIYVTDITVCEVGDYQKQVIFDKDIKWYTEKDGTIIVQPYDPAEGEGGVYIYHQINETQCEVIRFTQIYTWGNVYDIVGKAYRKDFSDLPKDANDKMPARFLIPLTLELMDSLPHHLASQAYYDSLKINLLGGDHVEVKWYESELFKDLILAVEIIGAIVSQQYEAAVFIIATTLLASNAKFGAYMGELFKANVLLEPLDYLMDKLGISEEVRTAIEHIAIAVAAAVLSAEGFGGASKFLIDSATWLTDSMVSGRQQNSLQEIQDEDDKARRDMLAQVAHIESVRKEEHLDVDAGLSEIAADAYTKVGMLPTDTPYSYIDRMLNTKNPIYRQIDTLYNYQDAYTDSSQILKYV